VEEDAQLGLRGARRRILRIRGSGVEMCLVEIEVTVRKMMIVTMMTVMMMTVTMMMMTVIDVVALSVFGSLRL
jgi:hypothetical protein